MLTHRGLYDKLVSYEDYPSYYDRQIDLDLNRTVSVQCSGEEKAQTLKSLRNLLQAFARRNPFLGYCQGLNFIAYFILTMGFT